MFTEQAEQSTTDSEAVLVQLFAGNRATNDLVGNSRSLVSIQCNAGYILSCIAECNRITVVGKNVMGICAVLLDVKLGIHRDISREGNAAAFVAGRDLQQAVCRNRGTVRCGQCFGCVQAELNVLDLAVHANAVVCILLQILEEVDSYLLADIGKGCRCGCYTDFLSGIDKLYRIDSIIENHAVRSGDLLHVVFAQIQQLACGGAIGTGGKRCDYLALAVTQCAVKGVNVLCGSDGKHSAGKSLYLIDGLIDAISHSNGGKYFAVLVDGNSSLLRCVRTLDGDNGDAILFRRGILGYIEVDRCLIQNIPRRSSDFDDGVTKSVRQILRSD